MNKLPLALIIGLGLSPAAGAQTVPACEAPLSALLAEWTAIGYPEPMKPMQSEVYGRGGHFASGPEVTSMRREIRAAAADCAATHADEADAARRVASVRARLERPSHDGN